MKYTYQISFNSSDYFDLTPGKSITMDGFWEEGTMIWREQISELYITKRENSSIYTTLESYFEDATKFETQIFVKILNDSVQESLHWFGIKWGVLDKHQATYTVQPIVYDFWGQYFENLKDEEIHASSSDTTLYRYYDTTTNYPSLDSKTGYTFMTRLRDILQDGSITWNSTDIVSTFLNGDDYEDASSLDTEYGVKVDYTTEEQSYMIYSGSTYKFLHSFSGFLSDLRLFNVWCFFDSNDKLRLEHVKFYIDKLVDNAVDYSAYIEDYDKVWSYESATIPTTDKIKMTTEDDQTDEDFIGYDIIYSEARNRPDAQTRELTSEFFSDMNFYDDEGLTKTDSLVFSTTLNKAYKWTNTSMSSFSATKNNLQCTAPGGGAGVATSNDFQTVALTGYTLKTNMSAISGTLSISIYDRTTTTIRSNTVNISSTGSASNTLTTLATGSRIDNYLRISLTASGSFTGWIVLENPNQERIDVPNIEGFASSSVKTNGAFSVANIFESWWQDNGLSRSATYNSVANTFNNTEYNLRRKEISVHLSSIPDALHGFNDGSRIAKIEKWTRDLDTDYYTIYLIYQEDE